MENDISLKKVVGWFLVVLILGTILSFTTGLLDLKMLEFFGTRKANVQHEIFKENKAHVEGMIDDLAKYKFQYIKAESDIEKEAIANMINSLFANFDEDEIDNDDLKEFLQTIRRGEDY